MSRSVSDAPAASAAIPAPSWWDAKIQPKTTPTRARPKVSAVRATVGGTVATQSSP